MKNSMKITNPLERACWILQGAGWEATADPSILENFQKAHLRIRQEYKNEIDNFLADLIDNYLPKKDLIIGKVVIVNFNEIKDLLHKQV